MELDIRDWMIVIGVLLFLAVVLDGYRRAQRERRQRVKLARSAGKVRFPQEDREGFNEVSVGSKRMVEQAAIKAAAQSAAASAHEEAGDENDPLFTNPFHKAAVASTIDASTAVDENTAENDELEASDYREHTVYGNEIGKEDNMHFEPIEPHINETNLEPWQDATTVNVDDLAEPLVADAKDDAIAPSQASEFSIFRTMADNFAHVKAEVKKVDKMIAGRKPQQAQLSVFDDEPENTASHTYEEPEEILVMHVLASDPEGFLGEDLLSILLGCDCRFGDKNIFHRYEAANGKGQVQFSVVNMVEPGIFVLDSIQEFTTPGVSLFMRLPGPTEAMDAFEAMVAVAQCIVKNLNGMLRDEFHNPMTEQTLEHERQRVRDYLQRRLRNHV